jgi:hypothetical protein
MLVQDHKQIFWKGIPMHAAYLGSTFMWPKEAPVSSVEHFYVQNITSATETVIAKTDETYGSAYVRYLFTSDDAENWTSLGQITTNGVSFSLAPNAKKYICFGASNNNPHTGYPNSKGMGQSINLLGFSKVGGDICSLNVADYKTRTTYPTNANYGYCELFNGNTNLVDASELLLRHDTLYHGIFEGTFQNCTSLVSAPNLPATTIAAGCYQFMFNGCSSLVNIPAILPATTLFVSCYSYMFNGCGLIIRTPVLPAPVLVDSCYNSMFSSTTSVPNSLTYVTCLATSGFDATSCTAYWLDGCPLNGTFVKAAGANWFIDTTYSEIPGYYYLTKGIPSLWTVVEQ